jgi:hypothetical protein
LIFEWVIGSRDVPSNHQSSCAEEMEQVGGLYNKLIAFLQSTGALAPAAASTEETN